MTDDFRNEPPDIDDLLDELERLLDEDDPSKIDFEELRRVARQLPKTERTKRFIDMIDTATAGDRKPSTTDLDEILGTGNAILDEFDEGSEE